ncbi:O-antigen ligase family protein [Edaphobacter aggregans]|uniref:O-antigen ligase family protein n=1 Tax=Edaphobacter aggregans TaxID=570835 RepID=UPI00054CE325|nr:O-antigen ligase family protein [Edaphobacter aggregans]
MGLFLTLLYIFTAYMGPWTVWGPVAEFHIQIILAALALVASLHGIQRSKIFIIPQTYALLGICSAVIISGVMTGWLGSIPEAVFGFIPNAFSFFLIVINCRTKRHLQLVIAVFFIVSAHAILRGYLALRAGDYLNPYLMPQGDDEGSRFYRLRGMAFINDPNDFGQVMVSLIPCLFFFWRKGSLLRNFLFILPAVALLIFGMYLTHSRGGMLALLAVILFASRRKIGTVPAAIIAAGGFAASRLIGWSGGRDVSVEAGAGRMEAWAVGLDLVKQHPFFGVGLGRFSEYFFITAHNTIIVCAAELGMFGLFWWVMFVLPTIRDATVCASLKTEKAPDNDEFSYDRALGVRREPVADLRWREPQYAVTEAAGGVMVAEDSANPAMAVPAHLVIETEDPKLPPEEIQRISRLMLYSIVGYFVAGWFLSRAFIMTLFIYGGMVQVIYRMALDQQLAPPRMNFYKVVQYSAAGAIGLILVVYIMLRVEHMMGVY